MLLLFSSDRQRSGASEDDNFKCHVTVLLQSLENWQEGIISMDGGDWVAFDEAETFKPAGIENAKKEEMSRRPKKRDKKRRSERDSSETNASTMSWMEKPISDDSSWFPIEPPRYESIEGRDDGESRRLNENAASISSNGATPISRPPRATRRSSSNAGSEDDPSRTGYQNRSYSNVPRDRGREQRPPSRGRAGSEYRDQPPPGSSHRTRGRSSSRTRTNSSPARARSSSKTRVEPVSQQRGRTRSTSRTRVESPSPRTRCKHRARSNSRTRVTSPSPRRIPVIPPMPNTEPRIRGRSSSLTPSGSRSRSQSMPRFRQSLSPRGGSSNRSVSSSGGGGAIPHHTQSFTNRSVSSEQLDFVSQINGQIQSSKKSTRKEGGIFERFFGDQVSDDARNGFRNNSVHSNVSIGSLGTSQQADSIHPRVLLSATVYKNAATNLWIATINTNQKGVATNPKLASKYLKAFSFGSEQEAREAAIANAPPKMMLFEGSSICFVCKGKFAVFRRARHCRNCGACVCGSCTTTWPSKTMPETYNLKNESVVKVCKSCSFLTESFQKALLKGDLDEAIDLYHTGNINLRCPLPAATGAKKAEIMYPVHCAVLGGNLDIVRWLLDEHFCPIKIVKKSTGKGRKSAGDTAIVTSKGRSVLNIAMSGLKVDIIRYLVVEKGVPVYETKDLQLSLRALEAVLLAFPVSHCTAEFERGGILPRWDETNFSDEDDGSYVCSSLGEDLSNLGELSFTENDPIETTDLVSHYSSLRAKHSYTSYALGSWLISHRFSASFAMTMPSIQLLLLAAIRFVVLNAALISKPVQYAMLNVTLSKSLNHEDFSCVGARRQAGVGAEVPFPFLIRLQVLSIS